MSTSIITEPVEISQVLVGDQLRFTPDSRVRAWWTVVGRSVDHVVAVRQAPFHPRGIVEYTVTGRLHGPRNGAGPGPIRSSLNTLGGGWDLSDPGAGSAEILAALETGEFQLSMRRVVDVCEVLRKVSV